MFVVTGGAGFIGANIVKALNDRGIDVNIRLEHEGQCPDWIAAKAHRALEISEKCL